MECYLLPRIQIMPAQSEAWRDISASIDARWRRNRVASRLVRMVGFVLCILGGTLAACAQERSTIFSPSFANLSLNLALFSKSSVSSSSLNGREQSMRLEFDSRFSTSLKELAAERELQNPLPKSLLRKRLVWISEGPRAKVRPGFGELFHGETVEPLRCSGAGVEDSRYLYVKFSFRF
jgi:hypothetical protein